MDLVERILAGHTDLVFDYVAQGLDVRGETGRQLLNACGYFGDVSAMKLLVAQGTPLRTSINEGGLVDAAFHGHWRLCQFLIENGWSVEGVPSHADDHAGETPLHVALLKPNRPKYDNVVRLPLANGANPNVKTKVGVPMAGLVMDARSQGETPLHRAAAFGTVVTVQLLLDAGAIVDATDAFGNTPLAWARWHHRPTAILERLRYGAFGKGNRSRSGTRPITAAGGSSGKSACGAIPMSAAGRTPRSSTSPPRRHRRGIGVSSAGWKHAKTRH